MAGDAGVEALHTVDESARPVLCHVIWVGAVDHVTGEVGRGDAAYGRRGVWKGVKVIVVSRVGT